MLQEIELVRKLKNKDIAAYELLYDNYSAPLFGTIINIVPEYALACTALADSFIKIWNSIGSYNESESRLFTWMLKIVILHCRSLGGNVEPDKATEYFIQINRFYDLK